MSKLLKIILWLGAIFSLVIIIAVIGLHSFVDPNDFKPEIETIVKDQTGRDLSIDGDLTLSVFPWLGVSTGKITLTNAPGFSDVKFAEIAACDIKVKVLPLLSKQIEISRIVLKGLQLNLAKNKQGVSNWEDLAKASDSEAEKAPTPTEQQAESAPETDGKMPAIASLAVAGVSLEDASITWHDQQNDQQLQLQDINFKTDSLQFNEPIAIDLGLTLVNAKPVFSEQLQLSTELILNEAMNQFTLKDLTINSITTSENLPDGNVTSDISGNIAIDLAAQIASISNFELAVNDLTMTTDLTAKNILTTPQINGPINIANFNLRQFLTQLGVKLPVMQDSSALTSFSIQFNLASTDNAIKLEQLQIKLDDSTLTGFVNITDLSQQAIAFKLDVDAINVDRYLAPKHTKTEKPNTEDTPIYPPSTAVATLLPIETLQALNANGQLAVGKLTAAGLTMQGITVNLKAKQGLIETKQKIEQLYQGQYSGGITINAQSKTPRLALNEQIKNVQLAPLLTDLSGENRMSGTINVNAKLNTRGNSISAIKSALNGTLNTEIKNGFVKGFDLQKIINTSQALLNGDSVLSHSDQEVTEFSELTASAKVRNGVITNDDLLAKSSKLRVNGKGKINLVTDSINYKANAKLIRREANATKLEKITGIPVGIVISGKLTDPSIDYDYSNVASFFAEKHRDKVEAKQEQLIEKIDEKLGKEVGDKARDLLKSFF